jgi:sterol desaturase/sphingolipid hydroxylase (fatty acid hydroxylase superfamily)
MEIVLILQGILLILGGHFAAATAVYLNHRFVFHGKWGNLPLLRETRKKHILHHRWAYGRHAHRHIIAPWWGQLLIAGAMAFIGQLFSWWFAVGILSFCFYYSHQHWAIHHDDDSSHCHYHHSFHHYNDKHANLSGVYPFIDRLGGTYVETRP